MSRSKVAWAMALALVVATGTARSAEPKPVGFTTSDGVEITADYYAPAGEEPAPVVILLHMYRSNRAAWDPLVPLLHKAGFAVVAIDLRGHGGSTKPGKARLAQRAGDRDPTLFNAMHEDVAAACRFLAEQPECDLSRFGIVGASVGCSVALDYARQDRSVDVVVCMSPGEAYLGVDSRQHIKEYAKPGQRPVLLLAAPGERKACETLAGIHTDAKVFITPPGSRDGDRVHGTRMFGQVPDIENRVVAFLTEHVGEPATAPVAADVTGGIFHAVGSDGDKKLTAASRRVFSSATEAERRGYKAPK